jgi:hypothetical protein
VHEVYAAAEECASTGLGRRGSRPIPGHHKSSLGQARVVKAGLPPCHPRVALRAVLTANQVIIGWAQAEGLLNDSLSREQFREILRKQYYSDETNNRRAGAAAGHMWRFIREMKPQDRIVVPRGRTSTWPKSSDPPHHI